MCNIKTAELKNNADSERLEGLEEKVNELDEKISSVTTNDFTDSVTGEILKIVLSFIINSYSCKGFQILFSDNYFRISLRKTASL